MADSTETSEPEAPEPATSDQPARNPEAPAASEAPAKSQSDFQAVLVEGQPVNHTLHAILTIFICLLWGIVWAIIAATGGEKRQMVVVDEFGNVLWQQLGKA